MCYGSAKFRYRKWLGIWDGSGNHDSPSKLFCLTVPKHLVGEPFCAVFQKFPIATRNIDKKGGGGKEGVSRFFVEKISSRKAKNFLEECFSVWLNWGIENVYEREREGEREEVLRYFFE